VNHERQTVNLLSVVPKPTLARGRLVSERLGEGVGREPLTSNGEPFVSRLRTHTRTGTFESKHF